MSCVAGPAQYVATPVDNAPNGLSERKRSAFARCVHGTNVQDVDYAIELFQERCQIRISAVLFLQGRYVPDENTGRIAAARTTQISDFTRWL